MGGLPVHLNTGYNTYSLITVLLFELQFSKLKPDVELYTYNHYPNFHFFFFTKEHEVSRCLFTVLYLYSI